MEVAKLGSMTKRKICYGIVQPGESVVDGIPVIKVNNIIAGLRDVSELDTTKKENDEKYSRTRLKGGELLLSVVGTIGKTAVVPMGFAGCNLVRATALIDIPDSQMTKWVKYYIDSPKGQYYIHENLNTTVQPTLNIKSIVDMPIPLFSNEYMEKATRILSSLDDKIELNRRINANLEAQAQALFKSWFVDFEPFRDGEFVESELGMIPKGWRVGSLSDIASINPTRSIKKGDKATYLDMKNMPTSGPFPLLCETKEYTGGMRFQNQDTLMARITPCLEKGKVAYVNFLEEKEIAFGSTEYIVMTTKDGFLPELLYFLCRDEYFKGYATKNMNGSSGRQRVSGETIGNYKIPLPPRSLLEPIAPYFKSVMDTIRNNGFESRRLATLRDTLLPRLMSGEIKVGDVTL